MGILYGFLLIVIAWITYCIVDAFIDRFQEVTRTIEIQNDHAEFNLEIARKSFEIKE